MLSSFSSLSFIWFTSAGNRRTNSLSGLLFQAADYFHSVYSRPQEVNPKRHGRRGRESYCSWRRLALILHLTPRAIFYGSGYSLERQVKTKPLPVTFISRRRKEKVNTREPDACFLSFYSFSLLVPAPFTTLSLGVNLLSRECMSWKGHRLCLVSIKD